MKTVGKLREQSRPRYVRREDIASVYMGPSEKNLTLTWLEKAGEGEMAFLTVNPSFDSLHGVPRLDALLRRVGVEPPSIPVEQTPWP